MAFRFLLLPLVFLLAGCESTNDHGHNHEDQGHGHENDERVAENHTVWTDKTELFVEFPVLVAGEESRFAAHFTVLDGHQPVREGSVTVSFIHGSEGIRQTTESPVSPGIFTPTLVPKEAGVGQLVFDLKTSEYSDRIVLNGIRVFASQQEAEQAQVAEEAEGGITFLKEQAWKMAFGTKPVQVGGIYEVVHTSGRWESSPTDSRTLAANASGVITYASALTEGVRVKRGDVLMTISSKNLTTNNLESELEQARADFEKISAEYARKQKLEASEIIPKAELEVVQREFLVSKSRLEALQSGYTPGGKQVTAPFDGVLKSIRKSNGDFVNQGDALLTIATHQSRLLETQLSPDRHRGPEDIYNIWYQPSAERWSSLKETGGSVLSIGHEVERDQPMLPVYALVNDVVEMPDGSFTEVDIAIGQADTGLLILASALLEDYGSYTVIVQTSGEQFERRAVTIGRRNGQLVEVLSGLSAGEIVVTKGAFQVKMAAMSGQVPSHGHAH